MATAKTPDLSGLKEFKMNVDVWSTYVSRLKAWFTIQDVKVAEFSKYLVAVVGTEPLDLIIDLCYPEKPETVSFESIVSLVEEHLSPKRSVIAERMIFRSCKQAEGQTISEYLVQLKKLSKNCKFTNNEMLKENLRDQFVYGLQNERIRQRMLTEDDELTFKRATELALSLEAAVRDSKPAAEAGHPASAPGFRGEAEPLYAVGGSAAHQRGGAGGGGARARGSRRASGHRPQRRGNGDDGRGGSTSSGGRCYRCDGRHPEHQCSFKNSECYVCGDVGHIAKTCRFRKVPKRVHGVTTKDGERVPTDESDPDDDPLYVYQLSDAEPDAKWTVKVMLFYVWIVALFAAAYLYFQQVYSRFKKPGVKNLKPVPIVGNMAPIILRTKHFVDVVNELYDKFPEERFVGNFEFIRPVLLIRDIELIKKITVKDFEYFLDHRTFVSEETDPFFGRNLFSLKGQEWKDMRSTLSPAFTSSKMKHMLPFIVEVGNQMVISLEQQLKESKNGYVDIEAKDLSTHFANDVIASCAFGLKVDSHLEPENEFYKMGYKSANFGFAALLKFFGFASFPYIMKLLKMNLFGEDVKNFFKHLVLSTMNDREVHNILRPDMIHLLMEAKKGRLVHEENSIQDADAGFATVEESNVGKKSINRAWSDVDLIAQAVLFFIAGFETVSTAMTFLLYELAVNPEVQEKLYEEIREHEGKTGGKFDYNSIQNMTYMDMVVSESLRLWPPAIASDRVCTKDYNLGRPNDKATEDFIIKKGEGLNIPICAIQRDPQYFANPLKFDPERFSEENKHKIQPFTYMPFGLGPRNCIGSRFALCEVKVMVYQLVQRYEIVPCERTSIPVELAKDNFNLRIKGGHWLRIKPRA